MIDCIQDIDQEKESLKQVLYELEAIDNELSRRRRDNGIAYYTPNPTQETAHNSKANIFLYSGGNRPLDKETLVKMASGEDKALKDIVIGDEVLAWSPIDNKCYPTKVNDYIDIGEEDCYKITLDDGLEVIATDDHCFPVFICGKSYRVQVKDVNIDDLFIVNNVCVRVNKIEPLGKKDVACIGIDYPSHYFVLSNGIITSNSGKSTFGAVETVFHTTGVYPDWYPEDRKFLNPVKVVIVATKFSIISEVIEPKLMSYMPKECILRKRKSPQGYLQNMNIQHKNGVSHIDFLTNEMSDMACESADWDFYWGDEPQEKGKFLAIQRGLIDRGGRTILTFTPLIEPWMKEDLIDKADGKEIDYVQANTRDNLFDIKGNPILSEDKIARFEKMLPDDVRETRIGGKFFHLRGIVYKEFSEVHLKDFDYEPGLPVICVLDPHDRQPHHVIWAILTKTDDVMVFYEIAKEGTIEQLSGAIYGVESHFNFKMRARLIDPNFGRKPLISTGRSVIEELARYKLHFKEANDNIEAGQLKVKEYLHYDRNRPLDINNTPKLFFHKKNCPLTIHSVRNLQYDEWVGKTREQRDPKEDTKKKDTHGSDCLRYLLMYNPTHNGHRSYTPYYQEAPY